MCCSLVNSVKYYSVSYGGMQVDVTSNKVEAEPGDEISFVTTASPNSVVVLGVIDKSLTLLADACRSLESNNVSLILFIL